MSGVDYDRDGRVTPFGKPDDALAGTAHYLVKRGKYRARRALGLRGAGAAGTTREGASRTYDAWQKAGVSRADGQPFPQPNAIGEALGAGMRAARPSCSARISMPCAPTTPR